MRISKLRGLLFAGTALMLVGAAAYADDQVETVVVTGTRIPRPEYDLPNPTTEIGADQIQESGTADLGDYLRRIPALEGSLGNFQLNGFATPSTDDGQSEAGLNLLDLRNLGFVRTLVLIDGKRSVSELPNSAAVDINTIPITMVDRVEVTTGGASSIYGADAVSGAVNFVMKHDLQGVHARIQVGTSQDGGGSTFITAVSAGQNFDDDKGNITLTAEGTYQDHLYFTQRKFTSVGTEQFFVTNPANPDGSIKNLPANIPTPDAQFILSAPTGAIWSDWNADFNPDFLGNGNPYVTGIPIGNASQIGGTGQPFTNDLEGDLQPTERRYITQIDSKYEFNRFFNVSFEFKWAHVDSKSTSSAPFDDFAVISEDNAFLPANVSQAIKNGSFAPFGVLSEDYLSIRNQEEVKRDTFRPTLDISGDLPNPSFLDKFRYDVSYVYGQSDIDDIDEHDRITDRFFAALDSVIDPSTHLPVCRSNLNPSAVPPDISLLFGPPVTFSDTTTVGPGDFPQTFTPGPNSGCVAFNPFGPKAASKAAIDFVTGNGHTRSAIQQQDINAYVGADLPVFKEMGLAEPLSLVGGVEYREEMSSSDPDALLQSNDAWISGLSPVHGSFNVWEIYGEANAPLIEDQPFIKELSLNAAIRNSHYSTAGVSTSWNYGGIYSPIEGLKFRATDAYAVRAPNIGELFAPNVNLFTAIADPCDPANLGTGTSFRTANCTAILNAIGLPLGTPLDTGATTPITVSGNQNLAPEAARTFTAGVVIQKADWGLTITADWYDVKITNAIQSLSGQDVADQCVDLSTINNPFCAAITRNPSTGSFKGAINHVSVQEINVASFGTGGVDYSIDYVVNSEDWFGKNYGTFDFHVIGNWLDHLTFQTLADQAPTQGAGTVAGGFDGSPAPRWQDNVDINWNYGNWKVDYNVNWYSHVLRSSLQAFQSQPNVYAKQYLYVPGLFEHSIQVDYDYKGWDLYAGVNNLFYQKPAIGESGGYPVDPIGRFFYMGVKIDLDSVDFSR